MINPNIQTSNRLPVLLAAAREAHDEAARYTVTAAERGLAAGAALVEAKALVGHGGWTARLRDTGIPERTAQRYMALHKAGCNSATVALFGWAEAERLASLGRKIWARDGYGFEAVAINGEAGRAYIVTLPHADGSATYFACYLFADPTLDFWMKKRCSAPIAFGILFDSINADFDLAHVRMMTPPETQAAWAEINGEFCK